MNFINKFINFLSSYFMKIINPISFPDSVLNINFWIRLTIFWCTIITWYWVKTCQITFCWKYILNKTSILSEWSIIFQKKLVALKLSFNAWNRMESVYWRNNYFFILNLLLQLLFETNKALCFYYIINIFLINSYMVYL